jgi:hypothetical protein
MIGSGHHESNIKMKGWSPFKGHEERDNTARVATEERNESRPGQQDDPPSSLSQRFPTAYLGALVVAVHIVSLYAIRFAPNSTKLP